MKLWCGLLAVLALFNSPTILGAQSSNAETATPTVAVARQPTLGGKPRPNILFIVMDDVGIDQMQIFGYGGATPPLTPNINAIARAGVRFRNVWSMPECSPSRAVFFEAAIPSGPTSAAPSSATIWPTPRCPHSRPPLRNC